ncbi:hypothetical protein AAZX31_04G222000 [Glycine max]
MVSVFCWNHRASSYTICLGFLSTTTSVPQISHWQAKDSYINKGWCGDLYLQATNLEFGKIQKNTCEPEREQSMNNLYYKCKH